VKRYDPARPHARLLTARGHEEWARSSVDVARQELETVWAGTPRRIRRRRDVRVLRQELDGRLNAVNQGLTLDPAEWVERPDDIGCVVFWAR
jgi:hypothetical protein